MVFLNSDGDKEEIDDDDIVESGGICQQSTPRFELHPSGRIPIFIMPDDDDEDDEEEENHHPKHKHNHHNKSSLLCLSLNIR